MQHVVLEVRALTVPYLKKKALDSISWTLLRQQNWLFTGASGSGKTTFAQALAGQVPHQGSLSYTFDDHTDLPAKAYLIANRHVFTDLVGDRNFYYQQRYNKQQERVTATVLHEFMAFADEENLHLQDAQDLIHRFDFEEVLHAQLVELSSGEHKKMQLIKGLWLQPQLLIIDEPYTGLDSAARRLLNDILDELAQKGVQLLLCTNDIELPTAITHYGQFQQGALQLVQRPEDRKPPAPSIRRPLPAFLALPPACAADTILNLQRVSIRYGDKEVLQDVSWTVRKGERWLLHGHNGSGKSTLLSIITGDHPQSYGLQMELFGQARGSGESIWDIKQKIGLISPEMHWYFDPRATVWHTVASGFYDTIGWFMDVKYEESVKINELLAYFDLTAYKNQRLNTLPLGQQRLAMLARSIIKNPALLVLDEPCQGLDQAQTESFNSLVDDLALPGRTLIYVGHYAYQLPKKLEHSLELHHGRVKAINHTIEQRIS